jgi:hypothetical protein
MALSQLYEAISFTTVALNNERYLRLRSQLLESNSEKEILPLCTLLRPAVSQR